MKGVHITETFDHGTGELKITEKKFSTKVSEDEKFFLVFNDSIDFMLRNSSTDIALLFKLCSIVEFDNAMIEFTSKKRSLMQEELKVSRQALSNSLNKLKKNKLISGNRDEYYINPALFWRGTTNGRKKYIKDNSDLIIKMFG